MIKNLSTFFVGIALSCLAGCTPIPKETTATKEYAPLEVPVPERPAGQQDVIELTTPKLDTVRVGFIGLGMRGPSAVERWTHIPGTKIVALCDLLPENAEKAQKIVTNAGMEAPALYSPAKMRLIPAPIKADSERYARATSNIAMSTAMVLSMKTIRCHCLIPTSYQE